MRAIAEGEVTDRAAGYQRLTRRQPRSGHVDLQRNDGIPATISSPAGVACFGVQVPDASAILRCGKCSMCPHVIVPLQIDLAVGARRVPVRPIGPSKPAGFA